EARSIRTVNRVEELISEVPASTEIKPYPLILAWPNEVNPINTSTINSNIFIILNRCNLILKHDYSQCAIHPFVQSTPFLYRLSRAPYHSDKYNDQKDKRCAMIHFVA